jgi:hypothetical protein
LFTDPDSFVAHVLALSTLEPSLVYDHIETSMAIQHWDHHMQDHAQKLSAQLAMKQLRDNT